MPELIYSLIALTIQQQFLNILGIEVIWIEI